MAVSEARSAGGAPGVAWPSVNQRMAAAGQLDSPVSGLRFVSAGRAKGLSRLGIATLGDLVSHFPFRYNDFSQAVAIAEAPLGERSTVVGQVHEVTVKRPRPRMTIVEVTLTDESGMCIASFYNQPWLARQITAGMRLVCLGQMQHSYGYRRMQSPLFSLLDEGEDGEAIQPVYRANSDISQGWLRRLIDEALAACAGQPDPLPPALRISQSLVDKRTALQQVHHPASMDACAAARRRLAFEEVFFLQLVLLGRKLASAASAAALALPAAGPALAALPASLPFELTADQSGAVAEILADLAGLQPMSRLLMGDVGSGKTVVALHALAAAADAGAQAAMMAPTEVLASQYASQLGPLLDRIGVSWALITSSTAPAEREMLLAGLAGGTIQVAFGTHALIEPDVAFGRLALVVVDEQHRFGVSQREALRAKAEASGAAAHYLAMTATPIPRSLALTIYGDLDISYIRSRPRANAQIVTQVINKRQISLAYDAVREALKRGEQAYIVCPLIGQPAQAASSSQDDGLEGEAALPELYDEYHQPEDENLTAARKERDFLASQVFPDHQVALLTSKLPAAEKRRVMEGFRAGRIDVLVSTTVIEVGVDVPNATVMVIQDAERFGLSQLHQLRGRVGRGQADGHVLLVSGARTPEAISRLALMEACSDGFELAEADLRSRQEGDVLGLRQHGQARLKLVQVIRDSDLIQSAHAEAKALLAADPGLEQPEHALLRHELARLAAAWQLEGGPAAAVGAGAR